MSVDCMNAVIEHSRAKGNEFIVLMVFALFASQKDWTVFLGVKRAGKLSHTSRATVNRCLRPLYARGDLKTISRKGSRVHTNVRQVMPSYAPVQLEARENRLPQHVRQTHLPHTLSPIPVVEPEVFASTREAMFASTREAVGVVGGRRTTTRDPRDPKPKSQVTERDNGGGYRESTSCQKFPPSKGGKELRKGLVSRGMPDNEIPLTYAMRLAKQFDVDAMLKAFDSNKDNVVSARSPIAYLRTIVQRRAKETKGSESDDWRDEYGL